LSFRRPELTWQLRKDIEDAEKALAQKEELAERLKEETQELKAANVKYYAEATGFQSIFEKYESLKERKEMFVKNSKNAQSAMQVMTGEQFWSSHCIR
jgi:DNA repair protein RAD50